MKTNLRNKRNKKSKQVDLWKMSKVKLIHRINTLELNIECLEDSIKDELYEKFMKKLGAPAREESLIRENEKLHERIKEYKQKILELEEDLKNGNCKVKRTRNKKV